jgi:hypothetical protein
LVLALLLGQSCGLRLHALQRRLRLQCGLQVLR